MTTSDAVGTRRTVTTPDGRTLLVHVAGAEDGPLVLVHHGSPCDGQLYADWHEDALARGWQLASWDRPGYGGSDRQPGRTVGSVARDAAAVANALGAEQFATWGYSGGGPHALACAALLPERVVAAASVAGVAPYGPDGMDHEAWLAGMGQDNLDEFGAALAGEGTLRPFLEEMRTQVLAATPEQLGEVLAGLLPPVDIDAANAGFGAFQHALFAGALAPGVDGWLDDDLAFVRAWGFDLDAVEVPVLITQGGQDLMVPAAHGLWLATHVAGAETVLDEDEGHLSLIRPGTPVHDWLAGYLKD